MLLKEHFPELADWRVILTATDFSTEMVQRTREGLFSQIEVNRGLPAPMLVKHFKRVGMEWQISEALRKMIDVRQLNLNEAWPGIEDVDIVFMRNVLIYFDVPSKQKIFARLRRSMKADGCLFLGAAETTLGVDPGFQAAEIERTLCYRLRG